MKSVTTHQYKEAKVTAYRLMLAMMHDDSDAIATVKRELKADSQDDPQRVLDVLGAMLGLATAQWNLLHHMVPDLGTVTVDLEEIDMNQEAAVKALEVQLAAAIDELNEP